MNKRDLAAHAFRAVTIAAGQLEERATWGSLYDLSMRAMNAPGRGVKRKRIGRAVVAVLVDVLGTEETA